MKARFIVPAIVLLAVGAPAAFAQPAGGMGPQNMPNTQQMGERFQRMDTMMGKANGAHGPERMALMQQHMQLMREQMKSMHSMMGGGRMGANDVMNGSGMGGGAAGGNTNMLNQMKTRMDMMQQMMGQMLDQQNMMMQSQPK
jgi:hypothetical protein